MKNKKQWKNKEKMNKDKFLKTKKAVQRKYPNAKTIMDNNGEY